MSILVSSSITLTLHFVRRPECFDAFWRSAHTRPLDKVSYSAELWRDLFVATFGSQPDGDADARWDQLFDDHQMLAVLREFTKSTAP